VSLDAVIEASRFLSPAAEEAWLAELDQDFNLDDKALVRLADEKVAPSVIDVLVAVSNPKVFSVASTGTVERTDDADSARVRRGYSPCFAPVVDPWAWYAYDPCDPYLRFSYYRPYYSRYGYGYGRYYDPFYGPYYGYGSPYYGGYGPVIIVRNGENPNHGRMTKGGYKPGSGATSGSASGGSSGGARAERPATRRGAPKDDAPAASSSDRGSSSGSSGSSSSSGSTSGSSSSGGRVATRKPPA
jgi:hypothetical protein